MQLKDLKQFLLNKYGLRFEPMIAGSKDIFTLSIPTQSKFFAILSRPRISKITHDLVLDVKCGEFANTVRDLPGFSRPFRIKSDEWVGVWLASAERSSVEKLLDYAYSLAINKKAPVTQAQYISVPQDKKVKTAYQAQTIPIRKNKINNQAIKKDNIPLQIKKMQSIYDYSILPSIGREKNFYAQAKLMEDYEDNFDKKIPFKRYYPTYHDMTIEQLRTYFTWRTQVRKGFYSPTSTSYVFIYIYELLNGIGVKNAQEGLKKLLELLDKYRDSEKYLIDNYVKIWLKDYLVFYHLNQKDLINEIFGEEIKDDAVYQALFKTDNPLIVAENLLSLANYKGRTPLEEIEFKKIIAQCWKQVLSLKNYDYFQNNVADQIDSEITLFNGAIFYQKVTNKKEFIINPTRKFYFDHGRWHYQYLMPMNHAKQKLKALLHEIDRVSREKFKKGRKLKPNNLSPLILDTIKNTIDNYYQQKLEAARPKININFNNLDQIRNNATITQESLLTEEEKQLDSEDLITTPELNSQLQSSEDESAEDFNLSADEKYFLLALIEKRPWEDYLKKHHLMASILADEINDKLFDEFGDTVIEFDENNNPQVVEDYQENLEELFLRKDK